MIIKEIGIYDTGDFRVGRCQIIWEDSDQPDMVITYATRHRKLVQSVAGAFLVNAIAPALWAGECRIMVREPVCDFLIANLLDFAYLQQHAYGLVRQPLTIDHRSASRRISTNSSSAVLFSGGVDSLYSVRSDRQKNMRGSSKSIRFGLWHARDHDFRAENADVVARMDAKASRLDPFIADTELEIVRVYSNSLLLWSGKNDFFWADKWHGAGFAAAGHFLDGGINRLYIPSSEIDLKYHKWGSTPLTDPYLSSNNLNVSHDGMRYSRRNKIALLTDWPVALKYMKVCFNNFPGQLNCGNCEKCLRTRLDFLCLGITNVPAFANAPPLSPNLFYGRATHDLNLLPFYEKISGQLTELGYDLLAEATRGFYERSLQTVENNHITWPD